MAKIEYPMLFASTCVFGQVRHTIHLFGSLRVWKCKIMFAVTTLAQQYHS